MKIGIIGGGQLGMMMAESAIKQGHTIISLDPNKFCSITKYSSKHIVKNYDDKEAFKELCEESDVITYEFENVNVDLVKKYEHKIPQKSKALSITQNRLTEKSFVKSLGIPVTEFYKYEGYIKEYPVIIKTTSGGYDGKGQYKIDSQDEVDQFIYNKENEYIVEHLVSFDYEISVILTRDVHGNIDIQPLTKNTHKNGILYISETKFLISNNAVEKAIQHAKEIIIALNYIGTMAIEFFVKGDHIVFNEYAPRPHNSGHNTIEGSTTSQFDNHIRAITGKKIENSSLIANNFMINVLGQDMKFVQTQEKYDECTLHMYHKTETKENRKMGHITCLSVNSKKLDKIKNDIIRSSHE